MESTRYEIKMTCDEIYLPDVRSWVQLHPDLFAEAYPSRQVNSLYFDTRDAEALNDNLIGVSERSKLRLRWYGKDYSAVQGVLELKRKVNRLAWKSYSPVPITLDLTAISWSELNQQLQQHAEGIVAAWLSFADQPMLLNSFTREYYESIDRQIRVTVDYDQKVYGQMTHLAPNLKFETPMRGQVVIEVKSDSSLYRRVSNVVTLFPLPVARNSKYVQGVLDSLGFVNPAIR
jgi:hypothetical protein